MCFIVGSFSMFFNVLCMLYLCVGDYLLGKVLLELDVFLLNMLVGVCLECYGLGWVFDVIEDLMVLDLLLSICECVIVCWL